VVILLLLHGTQWIKHDSFMMTAQCEAPDASEWCSTRVYVMIYRRNVNTGMGTKHVNEKNDGHRHSTVKQQACC